MTDKNDKKEVKVTDKKLSLKNDFLAIDDIKMKEIDLSEFNGPKGMFAKTISMKDFQDISKICTVLREGVDPAKAKPEDYEFSDDFIARTIAASVCDEAGDLVFTSEEIPFILAKSRTLFEAVSEVVSEMNGVITNEEVEEKEKK